MKNVDLIKMKNEILNELKKYADAKVAFNTKVNDILKENGKLISIYGSDLLISFLEEKIDKILASRLSNESKEDLLNLLYVVMETTLKGATLMAMDSETYNKKVKEYAEETLKEFDATLTEIENNK